MWSGVRRRMKRSVSGRARAQSLNGGQRWHARRRQNLVQQFVIGAVFIQRANCTVYTRYLQCIQPSTKLNICKRPISYYSQSVETEAEHCTDKINEVRGRIETIETVPGLCGQSQGLFPQPLTCLMRLQTVSASTLYTCLQSPLAPVWPPVVTKVLERAANKCITVKQKQSANG